MNGLEGIPGGLGVSSPVLPVKENALADRLDERDLHGSPLGSAGGLHGLVLRSKLFGISPGRGKHQSGLTAGGVLKGALISPSLFTISHNVERISVI